MKRKWSIQDDLELEKIVTDCLKKRINKTKAFEQAAKQLGRTKGTCSLRYYANQHKKKRVQMECRETMTHMLACYLRKCEQERKEEMEIITSLMVRARNKDKKRA